MEQFLVTSDDAIAAVDIIQKKKDNKKDRWVLPSLAVMVFFYSRFGTAKFIIFEIKYGVTFDYISPPFFFFLNIDNIFLLEITNYKPFKRSITNSPSEHLLCII